MCHSALPVEHLIEVLKRWSTIINGGHLTSFPAMLYAVSYDVRGYSRTVWRSSQSLASQTSGLRFGMAARSLRSCKGGGKVQYLSGSLLSWSWRLDTAVLSVGVVAGSNGCTGDGDGGGGTNSRR